jgi:hypothetical protein
LFVVSLCAAGCNRRHAPAPEDTSALPPAAPKAPPPTPRWEVKYSVKLGFDGAGFEKASCDFKLLTINAAPQLDVSCSDLPYPTEVTFDGVTQKSDDSKHNAFAFPGDFKPRLGSASLAAFKDKLNVKLAIPLEVTFAFPGREPLKVSPPSIWVSTDFLISWAGHPVRLGTVDRPDDGKKAAILVHQGYSGHELVGEGTVLDDLDFIAVQRDLDLPSVSCFGGRLVVRNEADVTLYDRRTGATVATQHFKNPRAGCPGSAVVGRSTEVQPGVGPDLVIPWLKARIVK